MAGDRATIADVARAASVAPSTASVVFSGRAGVSEATRRRVLEAAARLGYAGPDPRAASLRRGRSGIVGVVFEERLGAAFLDPVKTLMMDGLAEAVAPMDAGLLLLRDEPGAVQDQPGAEPGAEPTTAGALSLQSAPVDAVVLVGCSGRLAESLEVMRARGIPVVVIEGDAGEGIPRIELDNREAQRQAASHVRGLGHTDVVLLTLPFRAEDSRGWVTDDEVPVIEVTRHRLEGAREIYPQAPVYRATASLIDEGVAAGRAILAATDARVRPTAVIAQSDLLAAGVVRAAEELGIDVPGQLSVTGFDGVAVDGFAPRRLTTLVQPAAQKGRAAGEAVARMLANEPAASIRFTCDFRDGDTTGPVPRR